MPHPAMRQAASILLLAFPLVACPAWRELTFHKDGVEVREDVPYLPDGDAKHAVDWYLPSAGTNTVRRPLALFVHGGIWSAHDRRFFQWASGLYGGAGLALARAGYVAGVVGYRQHPQVAAQESLKDVAAAVAWATQHAAELGANPRCVVVVGHSAGALLAAQVALVPSHVASAGGDPGALRGAALLAGMYSVETALPNLEPEQATATAAFYGKDGTARLAWDVQVPAAAGAHPNILLLMGDQDAPWLLSGHKSMRAALEQGGGTLVEAVLPGEGHMDLVPSRSHGAVLERLQPWLEGVAAGCAGE